MTAVFVSHSSADSNFVELLVEILEFHHVSTWCSPTSITAGKAFPRAIQQALRDADCLLLIVSKNSVTSAWVTRELAAFETSRGSAPIIPLRLDAGIDPNRMLFGRRDLQWIDFTSSMRDGFRQLLVALGKEFLPRREQRAAADRRRVDDRRATQMGQRLRNRLWTAYEKATHKGRHEGDFGIIDKERLIRNDYLIEEVSRYTFLDRATSTKEFDPKEVVKHVVEQVWEQVRDLPHLPPINVIEAIAEYMHRRFDVRPMDRRKHGTRRRMVSLGESLSAVSGRHA